jgi:hypothetical protein
LGHALFDGLPWRVPRWCAQGRLPGRPQKGAERLDLREQPGPAPRPLGGLIPVPIEGRFQARPEPQGKAGTLRGVGEGYVHLLRHRLHDPVRGMAEPMERVLDAAGPEQGRGLERSPPRLVAEQARRTRKFHGPV